MSSSWQRSQVTAYRVSLSVRPALHSDYRAVVHIDSEHRIYGGKDYLPQLYHHVLRTPSAYSFVGEFGKRLICFVVMHVRESGAGVVMCSGRVSPSFEGLGIYKLFRGMVIDIMKEHFPALTWLRWQGLVSEERIQAIQSSENIVRVLHTWNFMGVYATRSIVAGIIHTLEDVKCYKHVRRLSCREVGDSLGSPEMCKKIIPGGILFTGPYWLPTLLPTQDTKSLHEENTLYGVFRDQGDSRTLCSLGVTTTYATAKNCFNAHFFYHGEPVLDTTLLYLRTVLADLLQICPLDDQTFTFCCHLPREMDSAEVEKRLPGVIHSHRDIAAFMERNRF